MLVRAKERQRDLVRKKKTSVMEWFGVKKFLETLDRRKIWYFWPIVNFLNASFPESKTCLFAFLLIYNSVFTERPKVKH